MEKVFVYAILRHFKILLIFPLFVLRAPSSRNAINQKS